MKSRDWDEWLAYMERYEGIVVVAKGGKMKYLRNGFVSLVLLGVFGLKVYSRICLVEWTVVRFIPQGQPFFPC